MATTNVVIYNTWTKIADNSQDFLASINTNGGAAASSPAGTVQPLPDLPAHLRDGLDGGQE